jgi:hypothetical protein
MAEFSQKSGVASYREEQEVYHLACVVGERDGAAHVQAEQLQYSLTQ